MKKEIKKLKDDFEEIANSNIGNFGFKERMRLERTLYVLLLDLTKMKLSGFNDFGVEKILEIENEKIKDIAYEIYKLKIFLKKISSSNPYERYDALNETNLNRKKIFVLMRKKIDRLVEEIENYCQ